MTSLAQLRALAEAAPRKVCSDACFGRWTVIERACTNASGEWLWHCRCECGTLRAVKASALRSGTSRSCGCLHREIVSKVSTRHGKTKTPEFTIWAGMISRCTTPTCGHFQHYGGRGITVCDRWHEFTNFLQDMGPRPSPKHSIDRINNNGNYEPANCRWATQSEQLMNARSTVVTPEFRAKVRKLLDAGVSGNQIAKQLGVARVTISRAIHLKP